MINVRDDEMYSVTSFIRYMGMLSYPVKQLLCKLLMISRTSSKFVIYSSNCFGMLFS